MLCTAAAREALVQRAAEVNARFAAAAEAAGGDVAEAFDAVAAAAPAALTPEGDATFQVLKSAFCGSISKFRILGFVPTTSAVLVALFATLAFPCSSFSSNLAFLLLRPLSAGCRAWSGTAPAMQTLRCRRHQRRRCRSSRARV